MIQRIFLLIFLTAATCQAQTSAISLSKNILGSNGSSFLENKGQWNKQAKYLLRSGNLDLWITDSGVVYDLFEVHHSQPPNMQPHYLLKQDTISRTGHVVRMSFLHTLHPFAAASNPLIGTTNYFIGNDSATWITGAHSFSDVTIRNIYNGIDARFYLDRGEPRYDVLLQPGADPANILMAFEGADGLESRSEGVLTIHTSMGDMEERALFAYQMIDGRKKQVDCRFHVETDASVSFIMGHYDHTQPVVIDPLIYSTFLGGSRDGIAAAIALDSSGNAYITGSTYSVDFPVSTGAYQTSNHGAPGFDAFVAKLNASGTALLYSTYLGGSAGTFGDFGSSIAVDRAGNAYLTGIAQSNDFPVTVNAFQPSSHSNNGVTSNAFITKLNSNGTALLYSTYLGGSSEYADNGGAGIVIDPTGNAYVAGSTTASNFPVTKGCFQNTNRAFVYNYGGHNTFISKLDPQGAKLVYSTLLGGTTDDEAAAITIDLSGNTYVTGWTRSTDFPITAGSFQASNNTVAPNQSAFITKLNSDGTKLIYSTYLGGAAINQPEAIAIDPSDNTFVTGWTQSFDFPVTPGAYQITNHATGGTANAFVTKLRADGSALMYSTYLGGSKTGQGNNIAVDQLGTAFVVGHTYVQGFPVPPGAPTSRDTGTNIFVTKFNPAGSMAVYSTIVGESIMDFGAGIALDHSDNVYIAGETNSPEFPVTLGAYETSNNSVRNHSTTGFVTKLSLFSSLASSDTSLKDLGSGSLCRRVDTMVVFGNLGTDTLTIKSIQLSGLDFSIVKQPSSTVFLPGKNDTVIIHYEPTKLGTSAGTLSIVTNAIDGGILTIPLIAQAVAPPLLHLTASLSKTSVLANDTTTLSIFPDSSISNDGLNSIEFAVRCNSDLLTALNTTNMMPGASLQAISQPDGSKIKLQITLSGSNMTLDPKQPVAIVKYRAAVTDSASTQIIITDPVLNANDNTYTRCVLTATGSSTAFTLTSACGTPTIMAALNHKLSLTIESIHPNPVAGNSVIMDIHSSKEQIVNASLYDILGRRVKSQQCSLTSGVNQCHFNLSGIPEGSYVLRVVSNEQEVVSRTISLEK